jgi:hypothetical protein
VTGKLTAFVNAGDITGLTKLCKSQPDRRELAKEARAAVARMNEDAKMTLPQREAAVAAFVATATLAELKKFAAQNGLFESLGDILEGVRPDWLPQAAETIIDVNVGCWPLARRLVRDKLAERPTSPNYVLGMFSWQFHDGEKHPTLADRLLSDPGLLENEIWGLFEVEGGGENSLAAHDKYCREGMSWEKALCSLSSAKKLPRQRLLDASLSALERDFAAFRAGWFSRFHEALSPTPDERRARKDAYLRLLASPIPATASFALEALVTLDRGSPLGAADLLPHAPAILGAKSKGAVKTVLRLLGSVAEREPKSARDVVHAAVHALGHEAADVQKAALDLVERHRDVFDAELAARIEGKSQLVAATLKKRLAGLVGAAPSKPAQAAPPKASPPVPAERVGPLDPSRALEPVRSLDDLLERLGHVLEDDGDPAEVDLVLDGVSRFCAERPADFERKTGPLKKRAASFRQRAQWQRPLSYVLGGVTTAWLAGEPLEKIEAARGVTFLEVFMERAREVSTRAIARQPRPLLSTPTHRGGFVDPEVLAERIAALTEAPGLHDAAIALLRLPPRAQVTGAKKPARGRAPSGLEIAAAFAYALGADVAVGDTAPIWVAAARARGPREDDPRVEARHPGLGPDAALAARSTWKVTTRKQDKYTFHELHLTTTPTAKKPKGIPVTALPSVLLHLTPAHACVAGFEKSLVRWAATVWPAGLESFAAAALEAFTSNLDWSSAEWKDVAFVEALRDPCNELGPHARTLLAAALAAKEPGESGVAVDVAIAALADGRLDGAALGEAMAALRASNLVKLARWAKTLAIVATTSEEHAREVRTAMERALRGDPSAAPRDEGAFVDLLCQLYAEAEARIGDPEALRYLSASRHAKKVTAFGTR